MRMVVPCAVLFIVVFRVANLYCPTSHSQLAVVFCVAFSCMGRFGMVGWPGLNCL